MGIVIFGFGPAFISTSELYVEHKWNYEDYKFYDLHRVFRSNFSYGNKLFYIFASAIFFVVYNLYLSFQFKNSFIVILQFLIVFALILLIITYLYAVVIKSYFEINLIDLLKLSFVSFFGNIIQLVRFGISIIAIYFIYRLNPGLLIFGIFSLLIVVSVESLSSWIEIIRETIVYEEE